MDNYDERIARIMAKIEALKEKEFSITCGDWPPTWEPPFSEEEVAAFEAEKGIRLPADYRRFITTVAGAGSQPFYGLLSFGRKKVRRSAPSLSRWSISSTSCI